MEIPKPIFTDMFNNEKVRIFGTGFEPLFVANDIAKMLDIKNPRDTIAKFSKTKKTKMIIPDSSGRLVSTNMLTFSGLIYMVYRSRKPEAEELEKRIIGEIIPLLRESDMRRLENAELVALRKLTTDLSQEVTRLKQLINPAVKYHDYDINDFTDQPCVYLLHLQQCDYKFGVSGDIYNRLDTHRRIFSKMGCNLRVVKLWRCANMQIMRETEAKIKRLAKFNNILIPKYGQTETITTDKIDYIVSNIDKYIMIQNDKEISCSEERKAELQIELVQAQTELAQAQSAPAIKQAEVEMKRLIMNLR